MLEEKKVMLRGTYGDGQRCVSCKMTCGEEERHSSGECNFCRARNKDD